MVCCGIKGYIISFINYIEALYLKKELFDYVFCIGDFFGHDKSCEIEWEKYKKSRKSGKKKQYFYIIVILIV